MALVTIDDRITRVGAKSVTLQIVERVDRDVFYTSDSSKELRHDQEGVTWIRGHYVLDSAEVRAAQAALALAVEPQQGVQAPRGGVQMPQGVQLPAFASPTYKEMIDRMVNARAKGIAPSELWPSPRRKTTLDG